MAETWTANFLFLGKHSTTELSCHPLTTFLYKGNLLTILYNLYLFNLFLQIEDTKLILSAGQRSYAGVLPLDETVGLNTRMVFIYSHGVNVTLRTSGNHSIQITENTELQYIRAFVEESLVSNQKQYKNRDTLLL